MLIPLDDLFSRRQIRPTGILHCGASSGQERDVYQKHCKGPVVWIEALPDVYEQLRANVAQWPNHVALNACLSDEDGTEVTFHEASNEGQSSSILSFGTHAREHPTVRFLRDIKMKTQRLDTLLTARGIAMPAGSFLSVDVQGMELPVLRGLGEMLCQFDCCYCELNWKPLYLKGALVGEVDAYLASFGFSRTETKWTKHGWGDGVFERTTRSGDVTPGEKSGSIAP